MTTVYVCKEVEVEVDLSDFDDDELIKELEDRKVSFNYTNTEEILYEIYLSRKLSKPYEHLVDKLIYESLGKII